MRAQVDEHVQRLCGQEGLEKMRRVKVSEWELVKGVGAVFPVGPAS